MMKLNEIGNYVERHTKGNIVELGCGEHPMKFDSIKVDKIKFDGYTQHDLNNKFPFKDKEFNTIIALQLIQYIRDLNLFIDECRRILKDDGVLILSVPNVNWWNIWNRPPNKDKHGEVFNHFSPKALSRMLATDGFDVKEIIPLGRCPFLSICGSFIVRCGELE